MARIAIACGLLGLSWLAACAKQPPDAGRTSATASASAVPSASGPAPAMVPHLVPSKAGCRALTVSGKVTVDGAPIGVGTLLDGEHWLALESGASVALRHTLTSREFKLIGPAHILPCRDGSEQLLVADGQLSTSANLGVRPGAEVLIATPAGAVHYGDAALDLEFGPKGQRVRVKQGEAWVEPEDRGKPHFENPVRTGSEAWLAPRRIDPRAIVATCEGSAQSAFASAQRVVKLGPAEPGDSLGARAAAHMRNRGKARIDCAIAAAAVGATNDLAEKQTLSASVAHAEVLWQAIPQAIPSQQN